MTKLILSVLAVAVLVPTGSARAQSSSDLFAETLQRVDLELHSSDWQKLKQNFQTNQSYPATFVWNGVSANAAIRSRGLGSRSGTKPHLEVDFNYYNPDGNFLGLTQVNLDNLIQDASGIHETVAMKMFARMGVPAPRETHARLYVNGEYAGLYGIVEAVNKEFLARIFGVIGEDTQNDGYLFDYTYLDEWHFTYPGSDLVWYRERFKPRTHENASDAKTVGPIEQLVRLVNETPSSGLAAAIGALLDIQAYLRFVAVQNFLGENDGFLGNWGINNFYLYRLENRTEHVFIAWDDDTAFWGPTYPVDARHDDNVLMRKLMAIPEYRDYYYAFLRDTANSAAEDVDGISWLESEIRRQLDLIDNSIRADTLKLYGNDSFEANAAAMKQFSRERINYVLCAVTNATGGSC